MAGVDVADEDLAPAAGLQLELVGPGAFGADLGAAARLQRTHLRHAHVNRDVAFVPDVRVPPEPDLEGLAFDDRLDQRDEVVVALEPERRSRAELDHDVDSARHRDPGERLHLPRVALELSAPANAVGHAAGGNEQEPEKREARHGSITHAGGRYFKAAPPAASAPNPARAPRAGSRTLCRGRR